MGVLRPAAAVVVTLHRFHRYPLHHAEDRARTILEVDVVRDVNPHKSRGIPDRHVV